VTFPAGVTNPVLFLAVPEDQVQTDPSVAVFIFSQAICIESGATQSGNTVFIDQTGNRFPIGSGSTLRYVQGAAITILGPVSTFQFQSTRQVEVIAFGWDD